MSAVAVLDRCTQARDTFGADAVAPALAALGISVEPEGQPAGPSIVAFDTYTDSVADAVSACSAEGRVLALRLLPEERPHDDSWDLLHSGASDVLCWDEGRAAPAIAARIARWEEVDAWVDSAVVVGSLVGSSPVWRMTLRRIIEIARFSSASVLLTGESGTGKEGVARLIHALDPRSHGSQGELVLVDCTTVVPALSGSEFFGHERGSFTGAVAARDGAFALADGGVLFLDEVGELPMSMQAELLRVVQEGTFKRVGSNAWNRTSFRLVCATNRDLLHEEANGSFRKDFYFRIAAAVVHLPPLRERREDIVPLFLHFLAEFLPGGRDAGPLLAPEVERLLQARSYPGNVRDLRQLALRVSTRHVGPGPITPGDLPEDEWPAPPAPSAGPAASDGFERAARLALSRGASLAQVQEAAAEAAIEVALTETGGNQAKAAKRLDVTPRALQYRRANQRRAQRRVGGNGEEPAF